MRTIKLILAYDGTHYVGWQAQDGGHSLQLTLERTIQRITGETLRVAASGRTDSGVHALGQVVSFRTQSDLPTRTLQRALNAELPRDMAVLSVEDMPPTFHARRHALRKRYRYDLLDGDVADIFRRDFAWQFFTRLNVDAMHRAAQKLVGKHDFRSFQTSGSPRASSVRTVYALDVTRDDAHPDLIHVEVEADGFLYNMVRAIVGTLVRVGRRMKDEDWPARVLAAANRSLAGRTAPAQGLFLLWVKYADQVGLEPQDAVVSGADNVPDNGGDA